MAKIYDTFRKVWNLENEEIWVLLVPPHLPLVLFLRNSFNYKKIYINGNLVIEGDVWARVIENENKRNYEIIIEETIVENNRKIIKEYLYYENEDESECGKLVFKKIKDSYCICSCHFDVIFFTNYINEGGCDECEVNH